MENQQIFNIVITLAGFAGGWILNSITRQLQRLEDKIGDVPLLYVTKDDYREDVAEIKALLQEIRRDMQQKADK